MGLKLTYLLRNFTRNRLRTVLTCLAVALPITIFVLSAAVIDGINRFLENSARQLRLIVTNRMSIVNPLPSGHRAKIESLDPSRQRLTAVCGVRWIGGVIENSSTPLSTLAVDPDTFVATLPEHRLASAEIQAWSRDRQALCAGRGTAAQLGWKPGDHVTIRSSVPPYTTVQFRVVSTLPDSEDGVTLWVRRDYVEEVMKFPGSISDWISFFYVKCASKPDLDRFKTEIDALFAGSPDETKTQDEKAFMNQFITQQFNLPRNLTILALVTIFVAMMAAMNTMGMNFRDRLNEFATMKALGFSGTLTFALIQVESLLLCGAGGALGALLPYVVFTHTPVREIPVPVIQVLIVQPHVVGYGVAIALAIGLLAAFLPSWRAARMNVVSALRNLE